MANPNDRYWNSPPSRPDADYGASSAHLRDDPPPYLRSRTPSFEANEDKAAANIRTGDELFYGAAYRGPETQGPTAYGQSLPRTQSAAQQASYFASPPGSNDGIGYSTLQNRYDQPSPRASGAATYQQTTSFDNAPYPATPGYNGTSPPPQHQPYNPATYQPPPQRHPSNTIGYSASSHYSPNLGGTTYSQSNFNATPYPTYTPAAPKPHPAQQQYANGPSTPYYSQYPTRTQYATQPQGYFGAQQQFSPGLTHPHSQIGYQPPAPPLPPKPLISPPTTYATSTNYTNPPYSNPPYPTFNSASVAPRQSVSQQGTITRPETRYTSDSEDSVSGDEAEAHPLPSPPKHKDEQFYNYNSQPLPSPPAPSPPSHAYPPYISTGQAQPRPLPARPSDGYGQGPESMFKGVEDRVVALTASAHGPSKHPIHGDEDDPLFDAPRYQSEDGETTDTNEQHSHYPYSDSSDAEALQGLEAIRKAEEDDRRMHRLKVKTSITVDLDDEDSDLGIGGVDLSMMDGGFAGDATGLYTAHSRQTSQTAEEKSLGRTSSSATYQTYSSLGRTISGATTSTVATTITQDSDDSELKRKRDIYDYTIPDDNALHPFPEFQAPTSSARVDTWGTGGNVDPSAVQRRLSFDEGDDGVGRRSSSHSPAKQIDSDVEFPELVYHPGLPNSTQSSPSYTRPLPSVPQTVPELSSPAPPNYMQAQTPPYPVASDPALLRKQSLPMRPELIGSSVSSQSASQVPRSTSLSAAHSVSSSHTVTPARSKTDATATTGRNNRQSVQVRPAVHLAGSDFDDPQNSLAISLPTIPACRRKKFEPSKLSSRDFKKCDRPWALSGITAWVKEMAEGEQDLKERTVVDGVVALFTHYVPTMNIADAETLATRVVKSMLNEGALVKEEEWVKFSDGEVCGVMYQICGGGCYAPKVHEQECSGRCYSYHCARTLRKIVLLQRPDELEKKSEDWATFWKLKKEDITTVNKKEIERQNNLHEIVQTESEYMEHLWVLQTVYRDQILRSDIIKDKRRDQFVRDIFGKADAVRKVSEEHLLPQLKFRQREQGPWIVGFSDIFREWIRKAKVMYIEYAANFPRADMLMRREVDRNIDFRQFLEQCRQDPRTRRLDWVTFLKAPITRLQRYSLLLLTVLRHTITESEEKQNLISAIEEIKAVTLECDSKVDEMTKRVVLLELRAKLIMRPGMEVDLRLEEKGREVIHRGDLLRNTNRFNFIETHAILFDHYLVLAKTIHQREVSGGAKQERYDVSRMPIPMDLLVLESTNDDPVIRSTANKLGLGTTAVKTTSDQRSGRTNTTAAPTQPLQHTSTSLSAASGKIAAVTVLEANNEKIMYPFRIKHLGKSFKADENTYTLYAPSAQARQDWCDKIIHAKERHAASLHTQNAEPFRIRVMADTAFAYDISAVSIPKPIPIRGTPLDRAIKEVEKMFEGIPFSIVCRASVNCATAFNDQLGRAMVAIGTDYGVYIADAKNPRGWFKAINVIKVTQIAVLEEFSLFLVLADKALIAYHLDVVLRHNGQTDTGKPRQPQKLSGAKDVGFFATGKMKERTLVFYKKREGLSSTFKVLEPVFQKATEKKSRFSRKGTTDFFREYTDFYIPADCYGLNLFHTSFAIHTSKGFEVMTLDTKHPVSIPELKAQHVAAIASRVNGQRPLGMFKLSEIEFLLCYEECAVYVNKHGDVSRSVIMEFVGKARAAAMYDRYILLFDNDFVEIRNAENGRLRQVIAGRDCRCLDDGLTGSSAGHRTIKVAMVHPDQDGRQLVIELLKNEGQSD